MQTVYCRYVLRFVGHDCSDASLSGWVLLPIWSQPVCRNRKHLYAVGYKKIGAVPDGFLLFDGHGGTGSLPSRNLLRRRQRPAVAMRGGHLQHAGGTISVLGVPCWVSVQPVGGRQLLSGYILRLSEHIGLCSDD